MQCNPLGNLSPISLMSDVINFHLSVLSLLTALEAAAKSEGSSHTNTEQGEEDDLIMPLYSLKKPQRIRKYVVHKSLYCALT